MHRWQFWIKLIHGWFIFSLINAVILYLWILNEQKDAPFIDQILNIFGAYLLLSLPGFVFYAIANRAHLMFPITYNQKLTQLINLLFFTVLTIGGMFVSAYFFERTVTLKSIMIAGISSLLFFIVPFFRKTLFNYE